ncbi:hypothetical protein L211DRAFT_837104 [Terfezia boudieri ATCC MYA-4762]|uniref:Yeast cell wall synthesis Kre9/Knh1-like N-terminal domain-containing protein n=1 Tax=Terfezia boudieri ATCC MYA-4762 TaxID=1051890 RepID=A0A3N4LP86_9PEZI|nr:hypothetical protein L211DRAFT_837104 [Terfezia boudieri ATCC MYA-4762]
MRFFTAALVALSTLAATVFAAENQITYPGAGDTVQGGQTIVIKWIPDTPDKTVKLVLRKGKSDDLDVSGPICDDCPNSGSYEWTAPKDIVAGKDYSIEIKFNSGVNYSPHFEIDSTVTARTTTGTTDTTDTTATATDTATTTTTTTTTEDSTTEASTTTATSATSSTVPTTTTLITSTTFYPNTTVALSTTTTTTSKPKTTGTSSTSTGTGAPDPNSGSAKTVSGGLVAIVVAAWALML